MSFRMDCVDPVNHQDVDSSGSRRSTAAWAAALVMLFSLSFAANSRQAAAQEDLQQREQAQLKARALAKQMVTGVLDIQLRQLEENGLAKKEVYRDIRATRDHLDELVDEEMQDIVDLLVEAQQGSQQERLEKFQQTRPLIREVVVGLLAERQRLQRRLKSARLSAEIRLLLERQSEVHQDTTAAADLSEAAKLEQALLLAEDQRDVAALFFQTMSLINDMQNWSGPMGVAAGRGLNLLRTANVEPELKTAALQLQKASFVPATQSQRRVLRALQALLEQVEAARGMVSADRAELVKKVELLAHRQDQLRQETLAADLEDEAARDALEESQRQLHRELGALSEEVRAVTEADPILLEQAKASALHSVDHIFATEGEEAASEQAKVVGNLEQLKNELAAAAGMDRSQRSSDDLLAEKVALEEAARQVAAARSQAQAAQRNLESNPAAAANSEATAAKQLDAAAALLDGGNVQSRLEEAAEAARIAEQSLRDDAAEVDERRRTAQQAEKALETAKSELAVRLADVERHRLAVEVGELARAAETLERAAAAQKRAAAKVSKDAASKADNDNESGGNRARLSSAEFHELAEQQTKVEEIAEEISKGVRRTAPSAVDELTRARTAARRAEAPLRRMTEGQRRPQELQESEKQLRQSADEFEKAAAEIRKRQEATADQLAGAAGRQLSQIAPVRQEVEQALDEANQVARPAEALRRALAEVQKASLAQLEAEGKQRLADARRQTNQLQQLEMAQQEAANAVRDFADGKTNSPLQAAAKQQAVADQARQLADALDASAEEDRDNGANSTSNAGRDVGKNNIKDNPLSAPLRRVARKAEEAARSALLDNSANASKAQEAVARAIADVGREAQKQMAEAQESPATKPNVQAQQAVAQSAGAAAKQAELAAGAEAGEAAKELEAAEDAATRAKNALAQGKDKVDEASQQQQQVRRSLDRAENKLREAIAKAEAAAATRQEAMRAKNRQLAEKTEGLDRAASQALKTAGQPATAATPNRPTPTTPPSEGSAPSNQDQQSKALERAVASLAARQQEIRRDFDVAAALADLARSQQDARETIRQQAKELNDLNDESEASVAEGKPDPHTNAKHAAAQSLEEATREFARTQQATGQGAVEISGQEEVVNEPIRRGLQKASELPAALLANEEEASQTKANGQEGQPQATTQASEGNTQQPNAQSSQGSQDSQESDGQQGGEAQTDNAPNTSADGQQGGSQGESANGQGEAGQGENAEGGQGQPEGDPSLGTGMVPSSAQVTANQIAGNQALQQAMDALEQGANQSQGASPNGASSTAGAETNDRESSTEKDDSRPAADSAIGVEGATDGEAGDRNVEMRRVEGEPWFSKLPPALQQAIRARARSTPPRGYEQRLQRYFEQGQ